MGTRPSDNFIDIIHGHLAGLLCANPAATSNEAFVQNTIEFALMNGGYSLRAGINYHGAKVQELRLNADGSLYGWNPGGDALATGRRAKMLLGGSTIVDREPDEPMMSDSKFSGGCLPVGKYIRVEYKVRGWLGKTKNLDGAQLEKDLDLLKNDRADLLVLCLSETAHRKWRGEGSVYHTSRRTGCERFSLVLRDFDFVRSQGVVDDEVMFEGSIWQVRSEYVEGGPSSWMPGAGHIITTCRVAAKILSF